MLLTMTALDELYARLRAERRDSPKPAQDRLAQSFVALELKRLADSAKDPRRIDQVRALAPDVAEAIWPT